MSDRAAARGGATGDRPTATLTGVEALVHLLVLRTVLDERDGLHTATMVSGYPGSPLGGFDLALEARRELLEAHRVLHRPGLNEELAAATVWGSQMGGTVPYAGVDGVVGAWYGKAPGLDRSGDALKHANAMGAGPNGGVVAFCGDDPTAKSSTLTCDSQHTFEDACMPVLYPGDQQEVVDLGVHAFSLSRYCGAWVGCKVVTAVADGIGTVDLSPDRLAPRPPDGTIVDGAPWRHVPLTTIGPHTVPDQELLVVEHRLRAARAYVRHNGLDRVVGAPPGARLGIVCAGKTYYDVLQALADLGHSVGDLESAGVRVLKLALTWPVVAETLTEFAATVDGLLVVEEKRPFVEGQVRSILHEQGSAVPVVGKRDGLGVPLVSPVGELDPAAVAAVLTRVLPDLAPPARSSVTLGDGAAPAAPAAPVALRALPARTPGFCSGCPHNRSTVVPVGALAGGGVGCHGIMYFEPRQAGTKKLAPTPMGAEGVPWIGLSPFVAAPHLIQNLGDGTLSHSGILAIRASVAAGVNITFKILYNAAVAMTGGQEVTGQRDVPSLTRVLEAEGVRRIVVCAEDPGHYGRRVRWAPGVEVVGRDRLPEVQERLRHVEGVTVIVYDQRCAAEARRLRKRGLLPTPPRRVHVNEAVCEGCGDCSVKSNCLSVVPHETEFGEKRQIHDPSCNRDYTCLEGDCPSFVTLTPKRRGRDRGRTPTASRPVPVVPAGELPDPPVAPLTAPYGIYFTGIGGTGVVTANRIVAAAAEAAGLRIAGMDQTGLSQKAGAVVSHLHLLAGADQPTTASVGRGGADLYLSGDILQAANPVHLAKAEPGRTTSVVNCDITRTTSMLQGGAQAPERAALEQAITAFLGSERVLFVDSTQIAEAAFADHLLANVVLLGAAYQLGALPLPLDCLEDALGRQANPGRNRDAFTWGRWAAHDPQAVAGALRAAAPAEAVLGGSIWDPSPDALGAARDLVGRRVLPAELGHLLVRRAAQVVDYQDARRAARFLDLVERAARRDDAAEGWALTEAVAGSWFKLLTYKDEYEVARLHLKADYDAVARDLGIEGPYALRYHLHPPTLRRAGLRRKLPMGKPYEWGFRALRRMRRLRGTPFDVFGWDRDRRLERALVEEYETMLSGLLGEDPGRPYAELVRIAASADSVKGYGRIKEESARRWRADVAEALGRHAVPSGS